MIGQRQRMYLRWALTKAPRVRWSIWGNFIRYKLTVAHYRDRGPDVLPFTPPNVVVWVTNRCNKDCEFCQYIDGLNAPNHRELELTLERFKELLQSPMVRNALRIALYGGEPLLNRHLPQMIAHAKRAGHIITVNTNGLLLQKRFEELLACPPDLLHISYYPEDRIKTEAAIALAAPRIPVIVNYMYSETRLNEIEEVIRCAVANNVMSVALESYVPQGLGADCELVDTTQSAPRLQRANHEQPVAGDDARLVDLRRRLNQKYGKRVTLTWRGEPGRKTVACRTFWNSTWIDAKGQMLPCCVWPIATFQGDVRNHHDAWNSQRMITLRSNMRQGRHPALCANCSYLNDNQLGF